MSGKSGLGIVWEEQPLGKKSDREISELLCVPRYMVTAARNRRGIRPFGITGPSARGSIVNPRWAHIDWETQPFGQVSDGAIARSLGIPVHLVSYQRRIRNIAAKKKIVQSKKHKAQDIRPTLGPWAENWHTFPRTDDPCRCCQDGATTPSKGLKYERRWTDQGAMCERHYSHLPPCASCDTNPVSNRGEWCEACCYQWQKTAGETSGWRVAINFDAADPIQYGDALGVEQAIERFVKKTESRISCTK